VNWRNLLRLLTCATLLLAPSLGNATVEWNIEKTLNLKNPPIDIAVSRNGKWIFILTAGGQIAIYSSAGLLEDTITVGPGIDRIKEGPDENILVLGNHETAAVQVLSLEFIQKINIAGAPVLGDTDAPVTIVVFAEFQCPYCSQLAPLLKKVIERYPGKVKLVFKHYPLKMHSVALAAATAAEVAGKTGEFWEFHDRLFQVTHQLSNEKIVEIAGDMGFDKEKFEKQMKDPSLLNRIQADIADGTKAGVQGVPKVFINGRPLKDRSSEGFDKMINEELRKLSAHKKTP
jgi:protein-disulfide isomerase